ncbi:MAG: gamma-glutamyltransferase, partial [bacterium]|nr:gamma-glutamyltransferase [bacterium]
PMCGLGGHLFAILYHARSGKVHNVNSSGAAPSGATPEFFRSRGHQFVPPSGPLSAEVPGQVNGWEAIQKRFCTRSLKELLQPAIAYASEGFPLPPILANTFSTSKALLASFSSTARVFLRDGQPPQTGDVLVQKDLARSLERVASGGAEEFYRGELAREIVAAHRAAGGLFTLDDFARHTTDVYDPLSTTYRGVTVYQTRPPTQGYMLLQMLDLLEGFDLASLGHLSAEAVHLMVEAKKLTFSDRNRYAGDPNTVPFRVEEFLSKEYAAERRKLIDPRRAASEAPAGVPAGTDTSYFCVADAEGNAVSLIHSLFAGFGSGFVAGNTGILLNNRARGFSLQEGHPNIIAPGKHTMHTLNCYMLFRDGVPWVIAGTPGGDFQTQGGVQIVTDLVDFGMRIQEAIDAPRWSSEPGTIPDTLHEPQRVEVEHGMPQETIRGLEARGHRVAPQGRGATKGIVQLIALDHRRGVKWGASDSRADGHAGAI